MSSLKLFLQEPSRAWRHTTDAKRENGVQGLPCDLAKQALHSNSLFSEEG